MKYYLIIILSFLVSELFGQAAGNILRSRGSTGTETILNNNNSNNTATRATVNSAALSNGEQHTFTVSILLNQSADTYLAVFNATQIGETAAQTEELLSTRVTNFVNGLKQYGIPETNIYIDMVSLLPVFGLEATEEKLFSKTFNEVPQGFELQKNIHILTSDITTVEKMVALAAENEIYDLVKVDYFVNDMLTVESQLRAKALEIVKKRMDTYSTLGINSTYEVEVHESMQTIYPINNYDSYQAFKTSSFAAIGRRTTVRQSDKQTTLYFKSVDYSNFDFIINPSYLAPPVQFVMQLTVKYYKIEKPENETTPNNIYYLISPSGAIQKLNIQE